MQVLIKPSKINGTISAPPSKSMAHRLLICAGLSNGTSKVKGVSFSQDILATLDCLEALGASYKVCDDTVVITGANHFSPGGSKQLNCRECGSTLRFMIPICMTSNNKFNLTGSQTLMKRPLDVYENIASKQNIEYMLNGNELHVRGPLKSGEYKIPGGISSQFVSGLLFSLPLIDGDSTICLIPPVESKPYIDMTIDALSRFGIEILCKDENTYFIKGNQTYKAADVMVEGDYSNSAFLEAFNLIGNNVIVNGLNPQSLQGDKVYSEMFNKLEQGYCKVDISDCPDLGPILFTVAALFKGALFTGTKRLKWKESDRASAMAEELKKCGISMTVNENTVEVHEGVPKKPQEILFGHNDHRIVMSLSVLLSKIGGAIDGAEAVEKSFPDFFDVLKSLGAEVECFGMDK